VLSLLWGPTRFGVFVVSDRQSPVDLFAAWVEIRMGEVDNLVDEARAKVAAIPDQRVLWEMVGELLLQVRMLEHDVAELLKKARQS
jgi:hypothetical protein